MKLIALILLFLRPAGLDFASGGAGLTGGILGMMNADNLAKPNYYMPGHAAQADQGWFAAMQAIQAATNRNTGLVDPVLLQSFSQMLGIDLAPLAAAGAQAGQQAGGLGEQAGFYGDVSQQQAGGAFGQADALRSAGAQTYQTGMDPQNQLHDRLRHQVVEGSRAADSSRGIATSGYSAGNENKATTDFEIDWQNQQLSRQLAGIQGMNQASYGAANSGALGGAQLGASMGYYGQMPGYTMSAATMPIQAQQAQYQMPMDWASMFSQAQGQNVQGPQGNVAAGYYPYIGGATNAASQQFQNQMARDTTQNQMQQQSQYGLWGGGQSGTNTMQGNQSGFGNPMNWMGWGSMFGGGGAGSGPPAGGGTGMNLGGGTGGLPW